MPFFDPMNTTLVPPWLFIRLSKAAEYKDFDTGAHIERIAHYCRIIAESLGLNSEMVQEIFLASPMHDIGKITIPDSILAKPGPLTPEERAIMECHTTRGFEILNFSAIPLLRLAAQIALHHHERFDGTGYPHRISGEQIPLEARIVAVADVFDALTSKRAYKPAWSLEQARDYLNEHSGRHFDPDCVKAFMNCWPQVLAFRAQRADCAERSATAA